MSTYEIVWRESLVISIPVGLVKYISVKLVVIVSGIGSTINNLR